MNKLFNKLYIATAVVIGSVSSSAVIAQEGSKAAPSKPKPAVVCEGYKRGPSTAIGQKAGKKLLKAIEAYNEDLVDEALAILQDVNAKSEYDIASVNSFIGRLMAGIDGKSAESLDYIKKSVSTKVLGDKDHADNLKATADLSLGEKKYQQAVDYYNKWMTFTCKQDGDVYTRLAQAFYELKQLDKMIEPADKAIALLKKPNKNPYLLKLTSYFERKMFPQTIEVAETLVKIFPEEPRWWSQLGFFYMLVEDYKKALATLELAHNKGHLKKKSEINTLAQLYSINDIPHRSAAMREKYMNTGLIEKDDKTLSALANAWHQAKEHRKAAKYYGEAAKLADDAELYRKQGVLLQTAERYKQALVALQIALDKGSEKKGRIHISMMESHFYSGNMKKALFHANEAKKDRSTARNARAWIPYIKEKASNRGIKI